MFPDYCPGQRSPRELAVALSLFRRHGIRSISQMLVLLHFASWKTQVELASEIGASQAFISRTLDVFDLAGLIESTAQGRHLTALGAGLIAELSGGPICYQPAEQAAAELAGAALVAREHFTPKALQVERDSSMAITPETFAAWNHHDMARPTELTLFSDGSGQLFDEMGEQIHEFNTPAEFAAFFE